MALFLPEIVNENTKFFYEMPKFTDTVCRIVFRTPVTNLRSDINGLDLYTSSVLGTDRYEVSNKLFPILNLSLKT